MLLEMSVASKRGDGREEELEEAALGASCELASQSGSGAHSAGRGRLDSLLLDCTLGLPQHTSTHLHARKMAA